MARNDDNDCTPPRGAPALTLAEVDAIMLIAKHKVLSRLEVSRPGHMGAATPSVFQDLEETDSAMAQDDDHNCTPREAPALTLAEVDAIMLIAKHKVLSRLEVSRPGHVGAARAKRLPRPRGNGQRNGSRR
jgi:hypothetical protein